MDINERTPACGLTDAEAAARAARGEANTSPKGTERGIGDILRANLFTFFNLINLLLGIALAAVGSFRNMAFLGTVLTNAVIGTVQELRTHRTLSRLRLMNESPVRVLREGRELSIPSAQIVRGDIVCLQLGDQIPADCIVVEGSGSVDESLLTGESDAIRKAPEDELLSGSFITSGAFRAQAVRVGAECYAAKLTKEARAIGNAGSGLMSEMRRLIRLISAVMLPLGILLFCRQYLLSGIELRKAVPTAVAAMVGMIPNGLMLLVSIALMVGVIRLGQRNVLVQELYGIEALARADVLCLDKTGTLTTGQMKVEALIPAEGCSAEALERQLSRVLGAFETRNGTSAALARVVAPGDERPVRVLEFSSERKYSAAEFADGDTLILGAPSYICRGPLPEAAAREMARGNRVVALCRARGSITDGGAPEARELLGLAVLSDELRPNVQETLRLFGEQGVALRVISGDDPVTVAAIAARLGLPGAEKAIDVSSLTEAQLAEAAETHVVFGRVRPEQKRMLVEALKARGHSVAMTGDGVNDIPAMKASDCSIAMASGSDAARRAAMITLLASDFAALPAVVGEGRRVVNNVTRAASLFLMKTLYSLFLTALLVFLPLAYPFQPVQLTLIASLTIGLPSFLLAVEPNAEPIRGYFLRTVVKRAAPGAVGVAVGACLAMLLDRFGLTTEECSTIAALCAAAAGIVMLWTVCIPFTRMRRTVLIGTAVLLTGAIAIAGSFFYIHVWQLSLLKGAITLGAIVICIACMLLVRRILRDRELSFMARLGL